jgi:SAM-dependent methyltransferase
VQHPNQRFAARPTVRLDRPRLSEAEVELARRERRDPVPTQWDYLHLFGLRRGILAGFQAATGAGGPVLDLYCGTKPYVELIPLRPVWGADIDVHFGRADVLASLPLPFHDGAFGVVLCTQALHLVDDPVTTVREAGRVLRTDGYVVVTVPHLFLAEGPFERRWSRDDLRALFEGWNDVRVASIDGPGAALAFVGGRVAMLAARRLRPLRLFYKPGTVILNALGTLVDALTRPLHRRWPHSFVLIARRPTQIDA